MNIVASKFRVLRVLTASIMMLSMIAVNSPLLAFAEEVPAPTETTPTLTVDTPTTLETSEPTPMCTLVSDTQTMQGETPASILSFVHPAWVTIANAFWIWGENPVSDPTVDQTEVFTRTFSLTAVPSTASVEIAADNGYVLKVNGNLVADNGAVEDNFSHTQTYDIAPWLVAGNNSVEVTVKNIGVPGSDAASNPAGLTYKITIDGSECGDVVPPPPPIPTITIVATDVTCENESDLPNWGAGGQTIGSTTATDFVKASKKACHTQSGWNFEWADQNGGDSTGNFTGPLGGAYTVFGPTSATGVATATVPLTPGTTEIHLREVLKPKYLGFSKDGNNNQSAEFYCSNDALGYDNWDFIRNPVPGATYHCAAFNTLATASVKVCKVSDAEGSPALPGWNVMLRGSYIENLTVPANSVTGVDTKNKFAGPTVSYLAKVTGTWLNQGGANPADAEYSTTDGWATHMDGYTGYSNDILELGINNKYGSWGPYNSAHEYAQSFTQTGIQKAHFGIFDGTVDGLGTHTQNPGWFGDNSGDLKVELFHGYAGITGEDGCTTFERVPYGNYTVEETPQDGWSYVFGGGDVTVDSPTETFTLVNHQTGSDSNPEPTTVLKTIVVRSADLAADFADAASTPSKWFFYDDVNDVINNALGSFVTGPQAPALGTGSAQMSVTGNERTNLVTAAFGGTPLSAITHLSFDTYNSSLGNGDPVTANHSAYMEFNVSFDGSDTYQSRLNFVPATNITGTIAPDSWKTWDAINSGTALWTYRDGATNWPVTAVGPHAGQTTTAPRTWADILADYPSAKMLGGPAAFFGVRVGEPYPNGYTEDVDNVVVGIQSGSVITKTSFDFEPTAVISDGPTQTFTTGGGSSSSSRLPTGQVLGAATSTPECGPLLATYMKQGAKNDEGEVTKLQTFLNKIMGTNVPVTGFFGSATKKLVTSFQEKFYADVLTPWAQVGKGLPHKGTGYVYKTTQRKINLLYCDSLTIPLPDVASD